MTSLARLIQVLGVPQLVDIPPFDNVHHLEADVAERLDSGIPFDGILVDLRGDRRGRELHGVRPRTVVLVTYRGEGRGFDLAGLDYTPTEVAQFYDQRGAYDVQTDRGRLRVSSTVVTPAAGVEYLLQVGFPLEQTDRAVANVERLLIWGSCLGLLASMLVGRWMAGRALAPLSRLAEATRPIDVATLDHRLPLRGSGDELDEVAEAFNQALARLQRSVSDMRQFSGALAHELRTPLAILRGEAELALTNPRAPEEVRRPLLSQLEEFDRLNGLITQILTLYRAEAGEIRLSRDPVDLVALTDSTVEQIEPIASARRIELTSMATGQVIIEGDEGWLRRLLLILLDNAIKFTAQGGHVSVAVSSNRDAVLWAVQDDGLGMSEDVLSHLFEPFYQADPARSRTEGAGLGLALGQWIANQHHGIIEVTSRPGHGSTFVTRFKGPRIPTSSPSVP